jgi:superfamily II DNA or RNA helicase
MKLYVKKDLQVREADEELREYLKALLTTVNPEFIDAKTFGRWTGNIEQFIHQYVETGKDITIPRGLLDHVLNDLGREFEEIIDERVTPAAEKVWPEGNIILRPDDQEPAVQEVMSFDNGFLSAPAGSGKTVMGLELARRLGLKALWLTHRQNLKDQTIEEAVNLLEIPKDRIGVLHGKKWSIGEQLTVGMIPTLGKRDLSEIEEEFGVVIVDEAHHIPSKTFLQVVNQFSAKYIFGLTATAYRRDKLEAIMFNSVGPVVSRIDHVDLIEDAHLIIPEVKRIRTGWIPPNANELEYHELMDAMIHSPLRNGKIVKDVVRECEVANNTCIVLVSRTKHAEILTEMLKKAGLRCEFVVGAVDVDDVDPSSGKRKKKAIPQEIRDQIVKDFKEGGLQVLVATYDLLAEGFNYRPLNRLFMASPIKWKGTVVQSLGRVQRPYETKENARVYDYVDWDITMFAKQADSRLFSVYRKMRIDVEDI